MRLGRVPPLHRLITDPVRMAINTIHVDANLEEEEIDYGNLSKYIFFVAVFV